MKYKNLIVVGTSHIARQSLDEVSRIIEDVKPEIVAVELDKRRLEALLSGETRKPSLRDIKVIGFNGYLFAVLGAWAQKKLGQQVGVIPGEEMKTAVKLAKKHGLKIAIIDENIEVILKKLSKEISWREKWNFVVDIFKGIFGLEKMEFDLSKVPEEKIISKMIEKIKKRYPNIYKVLIYDRNNLMAKRLGELMEKNPDKKIFAVVGAGHVEGISEILKKINPRVITEKSLAVSQK